MSAIEWLLVGAAVLWGVMRLRRKPGRAPRGTRLRRGRAYGRGRGGRTRASAHPAVEAAPERKPERIDLGGVQVRVPDGDGLTIVSPPGGAVRRWDRLRLWGIDAPEFPEQPFGYEAREKLIALVAKPGEIQRKGRRVEIRVKPGITGLVHRVQTKGGGDGRDPYGRTVVTLHDADGLCINEAMVEAGLAWQYHDDGAYS